MKNNSLIRAIVLATWAQVAWQRPEGTLSRILGPKHVCERYLTLRDTVMNQLLDASDATKLRYKRAAPTLLHSGVIVAKCALRHHPRLLRKITQLLNRHDSAQLRLGKNHFKYCSFSDSPWYFDFEICKGLLDLDLSLEDFERLSSERERLWPRYSEAELPAGLKLQWTRERALIASSSCSVVQKGHRPSQGVA